MTGLFLPAFSRMAVLERLLTVSFACLMDLLLGEPEILYHPVVAIGRLISFLERVLRRLTGTDREDGEAPRPGRERLAGGLLAVSVIVISVAVPVLLILAAEKLHHTAALTVEMIFGWELLAMRSLKEASMKVYKKLADGDLPGARKAVSMIVGRDTGGLTAEGVTKAAVETVAENASDGVGAPLLYFMLFGAPGAFFYKAVNTMDSMVGYRNDRYRYFGTAAARLDDAANYLPARITALCMILASFLLGMNGRGALRIWQRDRRKHASPNSAQTESVCAGALSIRLAGDASYFGEIHHKPYIGDEIRPAVYGDIPEANRLLFGTGGVLYAAGALVMIALILWLPA